MLDPTCKIPRVFNVKAKIDAMNKHFGTFPGHELEPFLLWQILHHLSFNLSVVVQLYHGPRCWIHQWIHRVLQSGSSCLDHQHVVELLLQSQQPVIFWRQDGLVQDIIEIMQRQFVRKQLRVIKVDSPSLELGNETGLEVLIFENLAFGAMAFLFLELKLRRRVVGIPLESLFREAICSKQFPLEALFLRMQLFFSQNLLRPHDIYINEMIKRSKIKMQKSHGSLSSKDLPYQSRTYLICRVFQALADFNRTLHLILGSQYTGQVTSPSKDEKFNLLYIIGKVQCFNRIVYSMHNHSEQNQLNRPQISESDRSSHRNNIQKPILKNYSPRQNIPRAGSFTDRSFYQRQGKTTKSRHISIIIPEEKYKLQSHSLTPKAQQARNYQVTSQKRLAYASNKSIPTGTDNLCKDLKEMLKIMQVHSAKRARRKTTLDSPTKYQKRQDKQLQIT